MAISTILAVGTSALASSDVIIAAGATARIGIFVATGALPDGVSASVLEVTPGAPNRVNTLTAHDPSRLFPGPNVVRVLRHAGLAVAIGAFQDV